MAPAWRILLGPGLAVLATGLALAPPAVAQAPRMHVTVTLRPRDPAALAAYARAVSSPFSGAYHRYLSPAQFARRFGAAPAQIAAVRRELRARGLRPGRPSRGALSIPLHATARQLERGLGVSLHELTLPGRRGIVASRPPSLGAGASGLVQSILGLSSISAPHPLLVRSTRRSAAPGRAVPHLVTGGPQPCPPAQTAAGAQHAHTADQIASAYGFSGLYGTGDQGAGVTVAIYELEPNATSDIAAYQDCYGTHASVGYVSVDGGSGSGSGSGEAALDIENLIGLAPRANVLVYQGPNSTSGAPGSGPYDTFSAIVNQDRARVVSVSWGQCESALGAAGAAAENTLFQQAAVQGQTIVAASGDNGSEDCGAGTRAQTQLAVDDPAGQPYVLGVGGTSLGSVARRPAESVWNNGGSAATVLLQAGAGGGGLSSFWTMSAAQLTAAPALNVLGGGPTGAQCGHPSGYCRAVPDVAAAADPSSGYLIYWNGAGDVLGQPAGWQSIGGTSAAGPVWAALLTLADASRACAGSPLGFAGPALYRAAGHAYAADFNDVTSGNNDFTATSAGRYTAAPGYDLASGLGSPNGAALAGDVCADTLALPGPRDQRSTVGAGVSLRLRAADVSQAGVTFAATGLPPGLALDPAGGRISGRPRRTGTFAVSLKAQDAQGSTAARAFSWSIGAAPRLSAVSLAGRLTGEPRLTFRVTAGRGAPGLKRLWVTLPDSLRLVSGGDLQVSAGRLRRPRLPGRLVRGALEIRLRRALNELQVALAYPELRLARDRKAHLRAPDAPNPRLTVQIRDASHGTITLQARVGAIRR